MRYLHCSDVHITADYFAVPFFKLGWRRWIAMAELQLGGRARTYAGARRSLEAIAADAGSPGIDHVILSGDLTAYSLESEFQGAQDALGKLAQDPRRCTIIPGNHDRYTPGALRSRRFEKYFQPVLQGDLPEYVAEDAFPVVKLLGEQDAVVALCSARVPKVPGMSYGVIGEPQFQALEKILADRRLERRAVLVVVHHGPFRQSGRLDKPMHRLRDVERLFSLVRGPRFALLHGHIHHRFYFPPTPQRPHIFNAGSSTEQGHEGYWIIDTRDGQVLGGQQVRPGELHLRRAG